MLSYVCLVCVCVVTTVVNGYHCGVFTVGEYQSNFCLTLKQDSASFHTCKKMWLYILVYL